MAKRQLYYSINIMTDYLQNNKRKIIDMYDFEWNEQEELETLFNLGVGRTKYREGILATAIGIKNVMKNLNLSKEEAMKALGIPNDQYPLYNAMLKMDLEKMLKI
mgnify:CR=1 FL=1